ncbi:MAG: glycosyltransferase family 4 protein [Alkalispirochaetaceae bacterium]
MDTIRRLALVGDYVPRRCGIAQFSYDLAHSVLETHPEIDLQVVSVNDRSEGYEYPAEVRFEIPEQKSTVYTQAAEYLHATNVDVVSLQHEFGIYGGPAGRHILAFLKLLRVPVVTTLHTVLQEPTEEQKRVFFEVAHRSTYLVTMSHRGEQMLRSIYGVPEERIAVIPHGIPDMPFVDPNFYKDQFGVDGKQVILTFGLLSPNKGIETMITALPTIVRSVPNVVYIVVGATHPNLLKSEGEAYRLSLERLAERLGVKEHVIFYNRFVSSAELLEFIGMADIYVTPYLNKAQITSGTLAYAFGCGKAVVSTPYWHAEELLADDRGLLVPFRDPEATAGAIVGLLEDEPRRHAMRKRAYMLGREMIWQRVGAQYSELFRRARLRQAEASSNRRYAVRTLAESARDLPQVRLHHLRALTDDVGILQHARYSVGNRQEGYCTDDNARALILTTLLREVGSNELAFLDALRQRCAAFLDHAYNRSSNSFRNFMSYDRRWLEQQGSADSQGRALWALGTIIGTSEDEQLVAWATEIFEEALGNVLSLKPLRTEAFLSLGVVSFLDRFGGDRQVRQAAETLIDRLLARYRESVQEGWNWYERMLTYDNGRIAEAVIRLGLALEREEAVEIGLESLHWLRALHSAPEGHFRAIGSRGFYKFGGVRTVYDQQPLEAAAAVGAAVAAFDATGESGWRDEAHRCFEWYLGRNDLGEPLYVPSVGGCYDGLMVDRVNRNMGAESTLSFLMALGQIEMLESRVASYGGSKKAGTAPRSVA